ncbi:LytR family transcriptional regulator [Coprobacillus sp. AF13-15]|uniref:LCP family protein n=1 Tax=Faecalibacillus intestinalis TaxID=1982626 RepID=UPI000E479164|nr:LytR family transcriptional regulator [Coprobacillus sp. AF13-4LB]RHS12858.1 LytR family transcriptional regulator [Coprobacillus sp. AF13-25]RHS15666.1 LytR family transcriptional regulator [Coprobacillus sp. AF13-15]
MEKLTKIISWPVILGIQVITTVVLLFFIFKLNILPTTYAVMVGMILVLLGFINYTLMKPNKKEHHHKTKPREIVGKVISLLLSVLMVFGSVMINKGYSTLDDITNSNTKSTHYAIVVLKSSKINSLSELQNESIEYCLQYDKEKDMNQVIAEAKKKESSLNFDVAMTYSKLGDDLYNNTVNAILINTAYNGMFEENHPDFQNEVKEIWTSDIETKVKDFSTRVSVTNTPFIIYISGIDTYGSITTVSRSDVNMIVTVNPNTKKILLTSIPRDYYVTLANMKKKDKLTHSGIAGPENTVKTMSNFIGIDINYYARVNFTSLITMVDALGGITIDVDREFYENGHTYSTGLQRMNGEQALEFSRERHSFADGDNVRVKHQQDVLMAMLNKMMSPAVITNYSSVLKAISGCFETNMASSDITDLIKMQINDNASWTFKQKQFTGTGVMQTGGAYMPDSKLYYMIPNDDSVKENLQAIKDVLNGK